MTHHIKSQAILDLFEPEWMGMVKTRNNGSLKKQNLGEYHV